MASNGKNKSKWGILAACAAIAALTGLFVYDAVVNVPEFTNSELAMGTVVTQTLKGNGAEETADKIVKNINNLEYKYLSWRIADSDIAKINKAAGSSYTPGENTAGWIRQTLDICQSSAGAVDITVGKLTALWDIGGENQRLPAQNEIDALLGGVGWSKITVSGNTIAIGEGQSLDMGAVGKGIACDEAAKILAQSKIKSAVVSVGGSILLYGKGKDVRVGIRSPLGGANDYMGVLTLKDCFISTSGNYEKFFTVGDTLYHHILNPATGYPADSGLTSVTVVCGSGLTADALSTACFVLGYEKSLPLLEEYKAEAIFIANDNTVRVTAGLADKFEITDSEFSLASTGAAR